MDSAAPTGGRYERVRSLGSGGGGTVWLVRDSLRDGALVALKELVDVAPGRTESLRREFATLRTLRHPNLVEVYEFETSADTGSPRFTLEFINGDDFVVTGHREGAATVVGLAAEALRALAFLHDFGVLHRDLKPANLLVRREPRNGSRVVVLDFGLALRTDEASASHLAGTRSYLAPELLQGSVPSRRSDIFGLGAVLYEVIYGRSPITQPQGEPERLGGQPHDVPVGLADWVAQMVALDPEDRPPSARDALVRLNAACNTSYEIETTLTRAARLNSGPPPGREAESARLWSLVAEDPHARVVLVTGDAGLGKSRLLRWLGAHAVGAGWDLGADVAERLNAPGTSTEPVFEEWCARAASRDALIVLDQLEAASSSVLEFVDRVARGGEPGRLRVVAAVRPAEIENEQLSKLLADTAWVPTIARVELKPLGSDSVVEVARRATGGAQPTAGQCEWLLKASDGNPLVLADLLIDAIWERGGEIPRTSTLDAVVQSRLARLTPPTRRWLEALNVLGHGVSAETVRLLAGLEAAEAQRATNEAEASGLVVRNRESFSPASRVVSSVVVSELDRERRVTLHRRAAEIEEQEGDPSRLARLWKEAGESERSIPWAIEAGAREKHAGRPAEAASWFRFALAQLVRGDSRRLSLRLSLADALMDAQYNSEAVRALGFVVRRGSTGVRVDALTKRAYALVLQGRCESAVCVAEQAIKLGRHDSVPSTVARASRVKALALLRLHRPADASAVALDAVESLQQYADPGTIAACLQVAGLAATRTGRLAEARTQLDRAATLARQSGDYRLASNCLVGLALAEMRGWNHVAALEHYHRAETLIEEQGLAAQRHVLLTAQALPALHIGRYDEAVRFVSEAEPLAVHLGNLQGVVLARLARGEALVHTGRPGEATDLMTRTIEIGPGFEPRFVLYLKVTLAEALLEEPHPDQERVRGLLRGVLDDPLIDRKGLFGALVVEMERRVLAGEPAQEIRDRFDAEARADRSLLEPPWEVRAMLAHARELYAAGDLDRSLAIARQALEIATTKDLPALAARLWAVVSEAEQRAGRLGPAREALDRARACLDSAAARIGDEQMRADFLGRPVFRPIRRSALGRATAAEGRLLAIYEMVRALNSESDPEALLETMLDMAIAVVRAERGLILLQEADGDYAVRASRNVEPDAAADALGFSRSVVLEAAAGTPVLAVDTGDDPRLRDLRSVSLYQIRSVLCVPLRSRGRRIGAVYLDNRSGGATFTPDDLGFLEAFADHAALALENATIRRELEQENRRLRAVTESRTRLGGLVGRSPGMQRAYDRIEKFAATTLPVLILGQSGTGKELAARAIHDGGSRRAKPFLVENCAAVADTLLESELFGHVRGAFTGAERDRPGLFEQAEGGTLFLDEIGDTTPAMQARLLRVLQEGEVRRVGDEIRRRVDVRVLAATNKDLEREVAEGRFRDDLRHRLQVLVLDLPPLCERPGDVALLVEELLERSGRERGTAAPRIRREVVDRLEQCAWPGNVRQLENCLKRLAVLAGEDPITLELVRSDDGLARLLLGEGPPPVPALRLDHNEKDQIRRALDAARGNRARAAKLLGISRATIFRKLKEHGLD